jgi:uncharacterized repeat protein (TIGR01451 family)
LRDEALSPPEPTTFEMYPAGTNVGPDPFLPPPGTGIPGSIVDYAPSSAPEQWARYYTFAPPVACGTYVLRAQSRTANENGWRLRFGNDNDANPNNAPPPNYDDPDGIPGTNDELTIGLAQTSYQHDVGAQACITLYQFVGQGQASIRFHNFDMDGPGGQSVTYTSPSGQTITGNPSAGTVWNGGTATTRVGDLVNNPEPGWWSIESCVSDHNQFIQEGQFNIPSYYAQPPTPRMIIEKDDGLTVVSPNQVVSYTIGFTNTSNVAPPTPPVPGAAANVVLTDVIPSETTFVSCGFNTPLYQGTCSQVSPGVVRFVFGPPQSWVNAGASGSLRVTVQVNANAVGPLTNTATLTYQDPLGNNFPPAVDDDINIIQPVTPTPTATATVPAPTATPTNTPPPTATNTPVPPPTDTPAPPTNTPVPPPTDTPAPPPTDTPVPPPTNTPVPLPTDTPGPPPTGTPPPPPPTNTPVPLPTDTPAPPPTDTPAVPPPTGTPAPPPTDTPAPPPPTPTNTVAPPPVVPPPVVPPPTPTASGTLPPGMPRSGAGGQDLAGTGSLLLALALALGLVLTGLLARRWDTRR